MKIIKLVVCCLLGLSCLNIPMSQSETITIGKGTGVVWEGMPFNVTLDKMLYNSSLQLKYGLLVISSHKQECMSSTSLTNIDGYPVLKITEGVGLLPRATGVVNFKLYNGTSASLTGTLGLPETEGIGVNNEIVTSSPGYGWCLPPSMSPSSNFYAAMEPRVVNIAGNWVMIADGSQSSSEIQLQPMYAASLAAGTGTGDLTTAILPSNITLRVSTLECSVDTVTAINFGSVSSNTQQNSELATVTAPLNITCGQPTDQIDANINVQFRAISGLYNNTPTQLSLDQGGGYITGEINNVTGSGDCGLTSGITFDNQQIKLGNITTADSTKVLNNNVTWRLCSGGSNLPVGDVTASTEMLVTFN
ncbi:hypothetical protein [Providencia rettgeri]|uniref:hypothetical protein n=1 Tax=Providencia rettgeri TaxID=587 RepID=UPI0020CA6AA3|nr:hypothetical protein [Providencia rettgeri]